MHLGAHGARHGACLAPGGPAAAGEFADVFTDGQRIPDHEGAVLEHRHAPRGAQDGQVARELGRTQRNQPFVERQAEMLEQDPGPQGPRRIVLVADRQQQITHARPSDTKIRRMAFGAVRAICFDLDNTLWEIEPVLLRAERILADWLLNRYPLIPQRFTPAEMLALRAALLRDEPHQAHDLTYLRRETLARAAAAVGYH